MARTKIYNVYQPIVEIKTRKIIGYEALTRGLGRERFPQHLFRTAYKEGSAIHLDLQCLVSAFQILPRLPKNVFLFVNIEPLTLITIFSEGEADQGMTLLSKVASYGKRIVFELTEGMKIRDFERVKRGLNHIRKLGCRFAIDDVAGMGAKLLRLVSLKPQFLKIDMTLIRGLAKNRLQQLLLHRIVELGKHNGCHLIAEGVEIKLDLEFVQKSGIRYAQGFYFSPPRKNLLKTLSA